MPHSLKQTNLTYQAIHHCSSRAPANSHGFLNPVITPLLLCVAFLISCRRSTGDPAAKRDAVSQCQGRRISWFGSSKQFPARLSALITRRTHAPTNATPASQRQLVAPLKSMHHKMNRPDQRNVPAATSSTITRSCYCMDLVPLKPGDSTSIISATHIF